MEYVVIEMGNKVVSSFRMNKVEASSWVSEFNVTAKADQNDVLRARITGNSDETPRARDVYHDLARSLSTNVETV